MAMAVCPSQIEVAAGVSILPCPQQPVSCLTHEVFKTGTVFVQGHNNNRPELSAIR
jgi:hypothetical protein